MSFESFKKWGIAHPNLLYIASWIGTAVILFMLLMLFFLSMPADTDLDDPVFEPIFTIIDLISIVVIVLPVSIAVLKIKQRSIWWLLLFLWHSPLWLSDSKQQCKANYIYAVLVVDAVLLTYGLTYTIEYAKTNPQDIIFYGFIIYFISVILSDIANHGLEKENNLAVENSTVHDAKDPEAKE